MRLVGAGRLQSKDMATQVAKPLTIFSSGMVT